MPATPLTPVSLARTSASGYDITVAMTAVDQANGMSFANDGRTLLRVKTAGTATTVGVTFPNTVDGQTVAARTYVMPATGDRIFGPFPPETYGAVVTLTFTSGTAATVAAIQPN